MRAATLKIPLSEELKGWAEQQVRQLGDPTAEEYVRSLLENLQKRQAVEETEAIEGVRRGLEDLDAGRTRPARDFLEDMRKKHELPR